MHIDLMSPYHLPENSESSGQAEKKFDESALINAIGAYPDAKYTWSDNSMCQYEFNRDFNALNHPQPILAITVYAPECPYHVTISFYVSGDKTTDLNNIDLAKKAFKYFTGIADINIDNTLKILDYKDYFDIIGYKTRSRFSKLINVYGIEIELDGV